MIYIYIYIYIYTYTDDTLCTHHLYSVLICYPTRSTDTHVHTRQGACMCILDSSRVFVQRRGHAYIHAKKPPFLHREYVRTNGIVLCTYKDAHPCTRCTVVCSKRVWHVQHLQIHTRIYVNKMNVVTRTHSRMQSLGTNVCACIQATHTHTCIYHCNMYTYIYVCTHKYTHTYIHAYIHI